MATKKPEPSPEIQIAELLLNKSVTHETILDSIPAIVFFKDKQNRLTRVNQALAQSMGLSKDQMEGRICSELWPDQADKYWSDDLQVMASGRPKRQIIEPLATSDGTRWLRTDKIPFHDETGHVVGVIGFSIDVTELRQSEQALQQSEEHYRSLVNNLNVGVYRSTGEPQGRFLNANPTIAKMFGYACVEDFMKCEASDLYFALEDRAFFVKEMKEKGRIRDRELRLKRKDGSLLLGSVTVTVEYDEHGEIRWMDGIIQDITERKRMEEVLRESESLLRSFFDSPGALRGVVELVDDDIIFVSCNAAMASLYGRDEKSIRGKRATELGVAEEIVRMLLAHYEESRRTNHSVSFEYSRMVGGIERWFYPTVSYLRTGPSGLPQFAFSMFDITERKQLEAVSRQAREVAEALGRELAERVRELEEALAHVKQLQGFLQICSYCKKIRIDQNYWQQVESYISQHADVSFSHGICPECFPKVMEEVHRYQGASQNRPPV